MTTHIGVGALNHVAINVRDLEASLRFYVDGLGMRKTLEKPISALTPRLMRLPEGTTAHTVFVQGTARTGQVELVKWNLPEPLGSVPKRPGDPGICVLSFPVETEHIGDVYARLLSMGVECYSEPTTTVVENYGPVTLFLCEDPDGNQVELISLPSREQVREYRSRQSGDTEGSNG